MDEIIKKSLRVMNKSEQTKSMLWRVRSVCDLTWPDHQQSVNLF